MDPNAGRRSGRRSGLRALVAVAGAPLAAWSAASSAYLLALTAAAAARRIAPPPAPSRPPRLVVLVPAHDEAPDIAACVEALLGCSYPEGARDVVVIADNCTDDTAAVAERAGAEAWVRTAPEARGKGQAIAWALERLRAEARDHDGVVVVDADCRASPNLLAALGARLAAGEDVVQADDAVANPEASAAAALRYAGFALFINVRHRGKTALGLSSGLVGTGMALSREVLEAVPWQAFSLAEDREYHLRLVVAGRRAVFAPEAAVASPMPVTHAEGETQQQRWEAGNAELGRRWAGSLIAGGLRSRRLDELHAGLELLVPAQSLAAAAAVAGGAAGVLGGSRRVRRLAGLALAGQAAYVLAGLRVAGAPPAVYRALASAPLLIAQRLRQFAALGRGRGASGWQRSPRQGPEPPGCQMAGSQSHRFPVRQ